MSLLLSLYLSMVMCVEDSIDLALWWGMLCQDAGGSVAQGVPLMYLTISVGHQTLGLCCRMEAMKTTNELDY